VDFRCRLNNSFELAYLKGFFNSDGSSMNNIPLCPGEISPGWGNLPPPTRAIYEIVW